MITLSAHGPFSIAVGEKSRPWCHQRPLRSIGGVVQGYVAKVNFRLPFAKSGLAITWHKFLELQSEQRCGSSSIDVDSIAIFRND